MFKRARPSVDESPNIGSRLPRLPRGVRVYAIGDIHGRIDLLRELEEMIVQDTSRDRKRVDYFLVYLGDFVDRGPNSFDVIEHLLLPAVSGFNRVLLRGNHDMWFRDFMDGETMGDSWLQFGGGATLDSYGVPFDYDRPDQQRFETARAALNELVPMSHKLFLDGLDLAFGLGDYFFCHAGVRPGIPLASQQESDLIWIREPFLSWQGNFGKIVVHGHTVEERPVLRSNRIGVDTGACFSGNLTCLILENDSMRFLATSPLTNPE